MFKRLAASTCFLPAFFQKLQHHPPQTKTMARFPCAQRDSCFLASQTFFCLVCPAVVGRKPRVQRGSKQGPAADTPGSSRGVQTICSTAAHHALPPSTDHSLLLSTPPFPPSPLLPGTVSQDTKTTRPVTPTKQGPQQRHCRKPSIMSLSITPTEKTQEILSQAKDLAIEMKNTQVRKGGREGWRGLAGSGRDGGRREGGKVGKEGGTAGGRWTCATAAHMVLPRSGHTRSGPGATT